MLSFMIINSKERDNTANSTLAMRRNWKSSYDVIHEANIRLIFAFQTGSLHMTSCLCAKVVSNISRNINFYDLDPVICKNSMCYSGSSQGMRIYIPCLFSISPQPISNPHMVLYFLYCITGHLLQGSVMEQPISKHRPRLSMT